MAPGAPIAGYSGTATVAAVAIENVTEWEYSDESDTETAGPYIGSSQTYEIDKGKKQTLDLTYEAKADTAPDAGQVDIAGHRAGGTTATYTMTPATGGFTITMTTAKVMSLTITHSADGTQVIKASISGTGAVTPIT